MFTMVVRTRQHSFKTFLTRTREEINSRGGPEYYFFGILGAVLNTPLPYSPLTYCNNNMLYYHTMVHIVLFDYTTIQLRQLSAAQGRIGLLRYGSH